MTKMIKITCDICGKEMKDEFCGEMRIVEVKNWTKVPVCYHLCNSCYQKLKDYYKELQRSK